MNLGDIYLKAFAAIIAMSLVLHHDGPRLGLHDPELSFEMDSAPNGKQLRVYY